MQFLIFIFWCVVAFYVLGLLVRFLLRGYLKRRQREFENLRNGAGKPPSGRTSRREGEVTVERIEVQEKHVNAKVGEYVDFEDIKEEKSENSAK